MNDPEKNSWNFMVYQNMNENMKYQNKPSHRVDWPIIGYLRNFLYQCFIETNNLTAEFLTHGSS